MASLRLVLALHIVQTLVRFVCVESNSESGEIAREKPIVATSTCGLILPEKYCYSTGEANVLCGVCDGDNHIEYVTDGHLSYWQSSVLSNDLADEHVNITVDLQQKFQIHDISVTTAFTRLPALWVIEASHDEGRQYSALKYFVSQASQCLTVFRLKEKDIENGLCIVQETMATGLSEKVDVSFDDTDNIIADHIRLRYIQLWQTKNPEKFEEFSKFYTLKEISIKGIRPSENTISHILTKRQACYCSQQGTAGAICNVPGRVCPCKRTYGGKRCTKCARGFYNYPTCLPCSCSKQGSLISSACKRQNGQCRCKPLIQGRTCNECQSGYSGFPSCKWCGCHITHTAKKICTNDGKCLCKENYDGKTCGQCKEGYTDYPSCKKQACYCKLTGATSVKCDSDGLCPCKKGFTAAKCDRCAVGFYDYPNCKECACHEKGSLFSECDSQSGKCVCYPYIDGRQCDRCLSGYFGFPRCQQCICNAYGTQRNATLGSGICPTGKEKFQCLCKKNVGGNTCGDCKDLYYNFSPRNPLGCKSCGCFKGGTIGGLESCDQNIGHCSCKPFIEEGKCHECRRGYHSIKSNDIFGCKACKCNPGGALYGNCDKRNGHCRCRKNIGGFQCDRPNSGPIYVPSLHHISVEMEDGLTIDRKKVEYDFDLSMFPSFSWRGYVQFSPEQSAAVLPINIRRLSTYRILFRYVFEPVGYPTTTEVSFTVSPNAGVPGYTRVVAMTISSTRNGGKERSALVSVSQDNVIEEFLMFKGVWTVTVSCENKYLLMDYLVFLPEEYYGGTILKTERVDPCVADSPKDKICERYSYPDISEAVKHEAELGYFSKKAWHSDKKLGLKYYRNNNVLKQMGANGMVLMNKEQNRFTMDMNIPQTGRYVFVVHYYHPGKTQEKIDLYVHREHGDVHIIPCVYQFGCRQVAMKDVKAVKVFDVEKGQTPLNLFTSEDASIAIDYVTAIPYKLWHAAYITPALVCRWLNGTCMMSEYEEPTTFERRPPTSRGSELSSIGDGSKITVVKFGQLFNKRAGNFYLIIQYKQTAHILVTGQVSVTTYSKKSYGVAQFKYCPNTEFCRIVIQPDGKGTVFTIPQGTTTIEIGFPLKKNVQLSWLYIIPANSYSDNMLSFTPIDNSKMFVDQCSRNNFYVKPVDKGFCLRSTFALSTDFNNGALPCRCSIYGARSRYCSKVYGQCICRRPNIIGRQCTQCASGYYRFPFCRRCACDPRGVVRSNCDRYGRCKCKPNYAGMNCNRCKDGHFDFPTCKPCDCDNRGSLSTFCTTTGQCMCRRSFDGKRCAKCRIGFFGFPECKECNCHAYGIKPLEGLPSGCNSSNAVECTCKDNVQGKQCDTCKDFHYNLQFGNPKGCDKCSCSSLGTNSQLKNCDKATGQCPCKPNIVGLSCTACKDGFTALRDYSIFGCKGCECDNGGSWDNTCNKKNGQCSCRRNVEGKKCTRVKSGGFYAKSLHHVRAEFENGTTSRGHAVTVRYSQQEFPGFSGRGYVPATQPDGTSSFDVIVAIPRPTKYRLLIRYVLDDSWPKYSQVTISPTEEVDPLPQGYESVQVASYTFKPTATRSQIYAKFLKVSKNGKEAAFFLSRGKWRISLHAAVSKLLLDYLVMIPEEYYKATDLRKRVQTPCLVDSSSDEFCVDYKYLKITNAYADTILTILGQFVGPRTLLPYSPFDGVVLTNVNQLYLPLPVTKQDYYVLMFTYYQETKSVNDLIVGVTSGFNHDTVRVRTYYCKYTFGCRQVTIDDDNKVKSFLLFPNANNYLSVGAQTTIALESVTIIPHKTWNVQYTIPEEHCVRTSAGCVQTTYNIHKNSIRVDAEKSGQGMKPTFAMDSSVRAAYLSGDGVSLRVKSRILKGRYKIFVHYYQPSHGNYNGRIIVESGRSTALSLPFKFCPNVGGCRALSRDKSTGMGRSLYIIGDIDITISVPAPNEVWIDYVLFVPIRHYSASMENQEAVSLAPKFIKECGNNNFIVDNSSTEFCKQSTFVLTTKFNGGASRCDCNREGSVSSVCDELGGQCRCKSNVIGRQCDKCKGGYTGFQNCTSG